MMLNIEIRITRRKKSIFHTHVHTYTHLVSRCHTSLENILKIITRRRLRTREYIVTSSKGVIPVCVLCVFIVYKTPLNLAKMHIPVSILSHGRGYIGIDPCAPVKRAYIHTLSRRCVML